MTNLENYKKTKNESWMNVKKQEDEMRLPWLARWQATQLPNAKKLFRVWTKMSASHVNIEPFSTILEDEAGAIQAAWDKTQTARIAIGINLASNAF